MLLDRFHNSNSIRNFRHVLFPNNSMYYYKIVYVKKNKKTTRKKTKKYKQTSSENFSPNMILKFTTSEPRQLFNF